MNVEIHIPVERIEELDDRTNSTTTIETHTETTLVIRRDVTANPNFDHFLQPKGDLLYDYIGNGEFSYGGEIFIQTSNDTQIKFDCYADQLREAAQARANEGPMHEVNVLAEWTHRAECSNYEQIDEDLNRALDQAAEDHPNVEYRKERGGGIHEKSGYSEFAEQS